MKKFVSTTVQKFDRQVIQELKANVAEAVQKRTFFQRIRNPASRTPFPKCSRLRIPKSQGPQSQQVKLVLEDCANSTRIVMTKNT